MERWILLESLLFLVHLLLVGAVGGDPRSQKEADLVKGLPGQPPVKFRHYAGYVKLRPREQKALFYWFFEAEADAANKPLVLWLNGGPGCSSVAYGAAQELGPFLVGGDGHQLTLNSFSWNKVANVLFLESPVGVGFSYTNNTLDLHRLGDKVTAEDSYVFLINWFQRFPEFKSHEFYIAGESYAGHYVPQLSEVIYDRNRKASNASYINFKGFMIGNAVINDITDTNGLIDYAWSHAIISDQLYNGLHKDCDFEKPDQQNQSEQCLLHVKAFSQAYHDIDIYSIYTPVCLTSESGSYRTKLSVSPRLLTNHDFWRKLPAGYDPCTEEYVKKYFNREDVQRALHANVTKLSYPYTPCSDVIEGWADSAETVLPIITKLLKAGLHIWIYSGDTDGRVPVTSTRYGLNKMGLRVEEEWRAWFHNHQVAGWVETYEGGLAFVTVRGAGHQVPAFAPDQSLALFSHFLSSKILPPSRF